MEQKNIKKEGFSFEDIAIIENIVASVRRHLAKEGVIHPKDAAFPFGYHTQHVIRCLDNAPNKKTLVSEIPRLLYAWGAENGPKAYAYQAIEAACRHIYGDKYGREMPDSLVQQINEELRNTTSDFVDFVRWRGAHMEPTQEKQMSFAL